MRQMVTEIHQGKLNIDQAVAKFEVNRKTVQRWIEVVEEEAETSSQIKADALLRLPNLKRTRSSRQLQEDGDEVGELKNKVRLLEGELEVAQFTTLYYTTLLRVAEDELGIDIEKKSATATADRKLSESC